jgi:hypothetical protein
MRRSLLEEAEACRQQAGLFVGKPEAEFCLCLARSFDELAIATHAAQQGPTFGGTDVMVPDSLTEFAP